MPASIHILPHPHAPTEAALRAIEAQFRSWRHYVKSDVRRAIRRGPGDLENRLRWGRVFGIFADRSDTLQSAIDAVECIHLRRKLGDWHARYTLPGWPGFVPGQLYALRLFLRWIRRYRAHKWDGIVAALAVPPTVNRCQNDFIAEAAE